jgi:pimeloyl-ACP methyl ester carboxylesterase
MRNEGQSRGRRDKLLTSRERHAVMALNSAGQTRGETGAWSDPAPHKSSFVISNGVRLHYLDWGGSGPALIFIHGGLGNPHFFDDLVPAFTDRFRVVAYARRGHGQSDAKGPYDTATLTEDLRGLMDGLGIAKANLVAHSMGGNEITGMAVSHPERVGRIVYLDAAFDPADPACAEAFKTLPPRIFAPTPASVLASLDAYRASFRTGLVGVSDTSRFEAWMRDSVMIQPDGTIRERISSIEAEKILAGVLADRRREYPRVKAPALVISGPTFLDVEHGDPAEAAENLAWERRYWTPYRVASVDRIRRELPSVEALEIQGTHMGFIFTSRKQVVAAMRRFLRAR